MKIILTFFWILIGAALLWFFAENLDQNVTIDVFGRTFEHINLVTVIFISTMLGLLLGAILMTWQVIKTKAGASALKKEVKKLSQKVEELQNTVREKELEIERSKKDLNQEDANSGLQV